MSTGSYTWPGVRVDADLPEQRLHAEGARLVRHDRHDQLADLLVAQQLRQHPHEHHRRRRLAPLGARVRTPRTAPAGRRSGLLRTFRLGTYPPSACAPLAHVLDLGAVLGGPVERRLADLGVRDRNAEARAERAQLVLVHLLLLVGDVLAFARLAETVALDCARQDDGRRALVLDRGLVGVVDLDRDRDRRA